MKHPIDGVFAIKKYKDGYAIHDGFGKFLEREDLEELVVGLMRTIIKHPKDMTWLNELSEKKTDD